MWLVSNLYLKFDVFLDPSYTIYHDNERIKLKKKWKWKLVEWNVKEKFWMKTMKWKYKRTLPSIVNLVPTQEIPSCIRPLRSVWSHPHKLGTLSSHRLCTFMSHAANTIQIFFINFSSSADIMQCRFRKKEEEEEERRILYCVKVKNVKSKKVFFSHQNIKERSWSWEQLLGKQKLEGNFFVLFKKKKKELNFKTIFFCCDET